MCPSHNFYFKFISNLSRKFSERSKLYALLPAEVFKKKNRLIILSYSDMYVLLFSWGAEKYCFLFLQQNILLLTQIWVLDKLQGWRASGEYLISFSYHRSSLSSRAIKLWCLVLVGKVMELDAVGCQFKPYPYCMLCLYQWLPHGVTWDAVHKGLWY